MSTPAVRPTYGIDRPGRVIATIACACFCLLLGLFFVGGTQSPRAGIAWFIVAAGLFAVGTARIATSLVGKPRWWDTVLDTLALRGDERALDAGCGRGLVAIGLARRLPAGRVLAVDLWRGRDQAGNARIATELNVKVCGLSERITVVEGDARRLHVGDASFDVVTASLLLGVLEPAERTAVLAELARVLVPGGTLVALDRRVAVPDDATLRATGLDVVTRKGVAGVPRLQGLVAQRRAASI